MKKRLRWLVAVLGIVAVAVALRLTVLAPHPLEVAVAAVDRGPVEETVTNTRAGTVKARLRAKLSPQTGGLVVRLPRRKGATVAKGELLLKLDDRVQQAALEVARREVVTARRRAEDACLAAELAEKELARAEDLAASGITSDQRLDAARTERDRTQAACRAARAAVEQAEAAVRAAEVQVELTELRAPPPPPGVPIPPVIDLLDPASLYVAAPIDEVDAERVRVGQPVRLSVDSRPGRHFAGSVVRIAPYVEDVLEQNRTVELEAELDDATLAAGLLPGTSADVEVILERRDDVLRVPTAAVAEGNAVLLLSDGRLVDRTMEPGLANWEYTEVVGGLDEGDRVVIARDSTAVKAGARAVAEDADD